MEKTVLLAASFYKKGFYFNERFGGLPKDVKDELRAACAVAAEKSRGIVTAGFYENGDVYLEASGDEQDYDYDEIGARLIIDALAEEKAELVKALGIWYKVAAKDK